MTNHEAISTPAAIGGPDRIDGWFLIARSARKARAGHERRRARDLVVRARGSSGCPIVLRLALTAQAAGARGLVLPPGGERDAMKRVLADHRLRIALYEADDPMLGQSSSEAPSIRVPANLVVHRAIFAELGAVGKATARCRGRGKSSSKPAFRKRAPSGKPRARPRARMGFRPSRSRDRATFRAAERALLRSLRKPQDGWTSTHLNRPISLAITRRLVATSLRPNQVSVAILAVGLLGAFLASRGTYASLVAGAALFHAQSVLDGCDGEMSRLTFRGSHLGEWLDTIGDDLTNYGFFGGAAWGLYTATGQMSYLALGGLTVFCGFVGSGLEYRYLVEIGSGDLLKYPLGIGKAPGSAANAAPKSALAKALDAMAPLFKRDTFVFLTLLGALAGAVGPLLAIFAVGAVGVLVAVIKAELRMARERAERAGASRHGAAEPSDVKPA